jgi:glyoxylase-like metal-dependent hydrolase (beta-lactamase superfamily II)
VTIPGIEVVHCRLNGPRGIVKAFLLHDDQSVVLIDTGYNDADADLIVERLLAIGREPSDLAMCIITHYHGDHVGGLAKLRSLASFPVVSHALDAEKIESTSGVKVDRTVEDGEELPEVGGLRIIHMPGHSPGSISIYAERTKALAVGDTIVSAGEHVIVSPPFLCDNSAQAVESVRRLLDLGLQIDTLLVAHGDNVYHTASAPLSRILAERRAAF